MDKEKLLKAQEHVTAQENLTLKCELYDAEFKIEELEADVRRLEKLLKALAENNMRLRLPVKECLDNGTIPLLPKPPLGPQKCMCSICTREDTVQLNEGRFARENNITFSEYLDMYKANVDIYISLGLSKRKAKREFFKNIKEELNA